MNIPKLSLPRWPARTDRPPVITDGEPVWWCVLLSIIGAALIVGSTWLLVVFIAGSVGHFDWFFDYRNASEGDRRFDWYFESAIHMPVAIGLALFCFGIACYNVIWWELQKRARTIKARNLYIGSGLIVALFMIAGATVVQQRGTEARDKDRAVAAKTADVAALTATTRLDLAKDELARMTDASVTTYQAQAARDGAKAWARRIEIARGIRDAQLPMLEKALASAERADELRAMLEAKVVAQGVAKADAAAATAEPDTSGWMAQTSRFIEDLRKPATSILGEFLSILIVSSAIAAWFTRKRSDVQPANYPAIADHTQEVAADAQAVHDHYWDGLNQGMTAEQATAYAQQQMEPAPVKKRPVDKDTGADLDYVQVGAFMRRKPKVRKLKTKVAGKPDDTEYEAPAKHVALNVEAEDGLQVDLGPRDAGDAKGDAGEGREHAGAVARGDEPAPQAVAEMEDAKNEMGRGGASLIGALSGDLSSVGDRGADHEGDSLVMGSAPASADDASGLASGDDSAGRVADAHDGNLQEPEAPPPLILDDSTVEALESIGAIKDGDLDEKFLTEAGEIDPEAVREYMADERGLPAPKDEPAEAA